MRAPPACPLVRETQSCLAALTDFGYVSVSAWLFCCCWTVEWWDMHASGSGAVQRGCGVFPIRMACDEALGRLAKKASGVCPLAICGIKQCYWYIQ